MRKSMLEYCKFVLEKVSFSKKLFVKELWKTNKFLSRRERYSLLAWLREKFSGTMPELIVRYEQNLKVRARMPVLMRA